MSLYKVILCDYLNPINDKKCEFVKNACVVLKKSTQGYKFFEKGPSKNLLKKYEEKKSVEVLDRRDQLMIPGFYDMHFHWVQDDVRLMPKDSLLEWLSKYTWPYESKFKKVSYSKAKAQKFSKELLRMGTVGGACYSSIHAHAVDHALKFFKGNYIVGNVLMTMNSPKYLSQTKANALSIVKSKSEKYKNKYCMTPRFAPTTHPEVMREGAKIARANKSFIQTHLSETPDEISYVKALYEKIPGFEKVKTYTEIYKKCRVLGKKTIMGHGIYLSREELEMLKDSGTKIAHCPTSNAPIKSLGLGSGLFDFKKVERLKIHWALASDIGGGPYLSMFDVIESFVSQNAKKNNGATYVKALNRATREGAAMLGVNSRTGSLDKGSFADFILLDTPTGLKEGHAPEQVLRKLLNFRGKTRTKCLDLVNETYLSGHLEYDKH